MKADRASSPTRPSSVSHLERQRMDLQRGALARVARGSHSARKPPAPRPGERARSAKEIETRRASSRSGASPWSRAREMSPGLARDVAAAGLCSARPPRATSPASASRTAAAAATPAAAGAIARLRFPPSAPGWLGACYASPLRSPPPRAAIARKAAPAPAAPSVSRVRDGSPPSDATSAKCLGRATSRRGTAGGERDQGGGPELRPRGRRGHEEDEGPTTAAAIAPRE